PFRIKAYADLLSMRFVSASSSDWTSCWASGWPWGLEWGCARGLEWGWASEWSAGWAWGCALEVRRASSMPSFASGSSATAQPLGTTAASWTMRPSGSCSARPAAAMPSSTGCCWTTSPPGTWSLRVVTHGPPIHPRPNWNRKLHDRRGEGIDDPSSIEDARQTVRGQMGGRTRLLPCGRDQRRAAAVGSHQPAVGNRDPAARWGGHSRPGSVAKPMTVQRQFVGTTSNLDLYEGGQENSIRPLGRGEGAGRVRRPERRDPGAHRRSWLRVPRRPIAY